MQDSRGTVRRRYAGTGEAYDDVRLRDPGGALLSRHDRRLFETLFRPPADATRVVELGAGTGRFTLAALAVLAALPTLPVDWQLLATDVNEGLLS